MVKMNSKNFQELYTKIRNQAIYKSKLGDFNGAINLFEILAKCAYNLNLFYSDDIIENELLFIGQKLVKRNKTFSNTNTQERKIIFFDSFGWDNRGLTQQYIRSFIKNNYNFLYILDQFKLKDSRDILQELNTYPNCQIFILENDIPTEKIKKLTKISEEYETTEVFLHLSPWALSAIIVWNLCKDVTRFQINLTDHAFWLGKNAFDYCIEFRNYGFNISAKYRQIPRNKLIKLQYYPIIKEINSFKGFPVDTNGKTIIVSGGTFYKVFGDQDKYFKLIKKIQRQNKNVIVLFPGGGDEITFKRKLIKYKLEKTIILIGNRDDISEVIRRADIYLSTYPIMGGLMGQFAIRSGIPIIGYSNPEIISNEIESLTINNKNIQLTFFDEKSFLKEINQMISSQEYRKKKASLLSNLVISENQFNVGIKKILNNDFNQNFEDLTININAFSKLYLEVENKYSHSTLKLLFASRYLFESNIKTKIERKYFFVFPKLFFKTILKSLLNRVFSKIKNRIIHYLHAQFELINKQYEKEKFNYIQNKLKSVGKNFQIGKDFIFKNPQYIEIGKNFSAMDRFRIEAWDLYQGKYYKPHIRIGDNVIFNTDIHIGSINSVIIGDNCLFASRIFISDHHHGNTEFNVMKLIPKDRPLISKGPVLIGENTWVGEGVAILSGVTIGENCIIATNSVVTKNIPANSVVAGIPAKVIKSL